MAGGGGNNAHFDRFYIMFRKVPTLKIVARVGFFVWEKNFFFSLDVSLAKTKKLLTFPRVIPF